MTGSFLQEDSALERALREPPSTPVRVAAFSTATAGE